MKPIKVAFAVPLDKWQNAAWWARLNKHVLDAERDPLIEYIDTIAVGAAAPDWIKSKATKVVFGPYERGLTDTNRNLATKIVLATNADYIYWTDTDTIHPKGTLRHLLDLQHPFVSGVYYHKSDPYEPLAYKRTASGQYQTVQVPRAGELKELDSVGMGCALVHRSVYQDIVDSHSVFYRQNRTLVVAHNDDIIYKSAPGTVKRSAGKVMVADDGIYSVDKLAPVEPFSDKFDWPFYVMEYLRTEDHWFCELAERAGHKPMLDSTVNCRHSGEYGYGRNDYREAMARRRREMADESS